MSRWWTPPAAFIPQADEPRLLRAAVGTAPPSIDALRDLERGLLLSGLGNMAVVRKPTCCFLHCMGDGVRMGPPDTSRDRRRPLYRQRATWERHGDGQGRLQAALPGGGVPTADWVMAPADADRGGARSLDGRWWSSRPSRVHCRLTVVKDPRSYDRGCGSGARYDDEVMIEAFVPGRELTVGVLEGRALAVGEIIPRHEIFDYECKYTPGCPRRSFRPTCRPDLAGSASGWGCSPTRP